MVILVQDVGEKSGKSDAIKVDLGGGASAAKGFDLFSRRMLVLTFRASIYEKLDRLDLALLTYEEKLRLLKDAKGDKRARAEEISILENNLGEMRLRAGYHGPAKEAFAAAESDAKTLRASDQKEKSPAELTNRLNRARVELRLASMGLLAASDLDASSSDLDASAAEIRPAYQSGVRAQGKPLAQLLDVSSALKATKTNSSEAGTKEKISAEIGESLAIMQAIGAAPDVMAGPLLNYTAVDGAAAKDPAINKLLVEFEKVAASTPSLEWKVLATKGDVGRAFEALDRVLAAGGALHTPADRRLARRLYETLLQAAWQRGDINQIATLMRRFALMHGTDLARRGGMEKGRIAKLLGMKDLIKLQVVLGDQDAIMMAHRSLDNSVYVVVITKTALSKAKVEVAAGKVVTPEAYSQLFADPGLSGVLGTGTVYIVPDGELYDLPWEQIKHRRGPLEKRSLWLFYRLQI